MKFDWDADKAAINLQKHGVSFDEAASVFGDPFSLTTTDPLHSSTEDRFVDIGYSAQGRLLIVVYVERENRIRIISSRKATSAERQIYEA